MRLPNVARAEIPEDKIVLYLLNLEHRDGKSKPQFFRVFGFVPEEWQKLAEALRLHAAQHNVATSKETLYRTKYTVDGELEVPSGVRPNARVVWFVEEGEENPRLVTAHPITRKQGME